MAYSGNSGEKLSETSRRHVLSVAYWRFFVNALLVLLRYGCLHHRFGDRIRGAEYR